MLKISRRRARELETNFGVDWKGENAPKMENGKSERECVNELQGKMKMKERNIQV